MDIINLLYLNGFIQSRLVSHELLTKRINLFMSGIRQKTLVELIKTRTQAQYRWARPIKKTDPDVLNRHIRSVLGLDK